MPVTGRVEVKLDFADFWLSFKTLVGNELANESFEISLDGVFEAIDYLDYILTV